MTANWGAPISLEGAVDEWAQSIEGSVEAGLQATVPVKTGATQGLIEANANHTGVDATGDAIAGFLVTGTRAHEIHGNPWLYWPEAEHPVKLVHHPGTAPEPFVENAIDAHEVEWSDALLSAITQQW